MAYKKVTITIDEETLSKVKNEANKQDRNLSNMIVVILKKFFSK